MNNNTNNKENSTTTSNNSDSKQKGFGLAITTSMVIGTMIGSGIFLLPASLAEFGSISFVGWAITALGALCIAWVFAKLSGWQPGLGGPYYYTRLGVGEFPAFLVAWGYWVSIWVGNAAVSIAAASYLSLIIPEIKSYSWLTPVIALGFVWFFTWINIKGVREAGIVQLLLTLLKGIPLILFGLVGLFFIDFDLVSQTPEVEQSLGASVLAAMSLWLWAFLGVESASIPADNINEPRKTIPRATLIGVVLVACIYLFGSIVVFGSMSLSELSNSAGPYADAAGKIWGGWAFYAMATVAIVSSIGALNGLILLGGQMPRAAANDGLFLKSFAELNSDGAPAKGLIISAILTSLLVLTNLSESTLGLFTFSILLSTTSVLIPYIFCASAAIRLQPKETAKPMTTIIFILGLIYSLWALGGSGEDAVYWGFILAMASVPVYIVIKMVNDPKTTD